MLARWNRTWNAVGMTPPTGLFEQLAAAYSEPHRRYHTLHHLFECFTLYDDLPDVEGKSYRIELALWFHDFVYDPRSSTNEVQSAKIARHALEAAALPPGEIDAIADLILATQHGESDPATPEAQLLVDIDLSILGAPSERFAEYEHQIREEYRHVPPDAFREGRRAFVRKLLALPRLYHTPHLSERFEAAAQGNLARYAT